MKTILHLTAALILCAAAAPGQEVAWSATSNFTPVLGGLSTSETLVRVPDASGDGIDDYLVAIGASLWDLHSGADGSFVRAIGGLPAAGLFSFPAVAVLDDLDGDGHAEVAIAEGLSVVVRSSLTNFIVASTLLPAFVGSFAAQSPVPVLESVPDADGDGHRDYAVGIALAGFGIAPLYVAPGGPPTTPPTTPPVYTPLPTTVEIRSGATGAIITSIPGPTSASALTRRVREAGDFDGDGIPEIAIAEISQTVARIDVYALGGTLLTSFTPTGHWAITPSTTFDLEHDLTGDGVPDLVVGVPYAAAGRGAIEIYSGADGSLVRTVLGAPSTQLGARLFLGDLDGDGRAEIAAANAPYGIGGVPRILVLDASHGSELATTAGYLPRGETATFLDVDGDGHRDLIVAGQDGGWTATHHVALRGGFGLGPAGIGSALGEGLLRVNGRTGAWTRRVEVGRATPLLFELQAPVGSSTSFHFAIFGFLGVAGMADALTSAERSARWPSSRASPIRPESPSSSRSRRASTACRERSSSRRRAPGRSRCRPGSTPRSVSRCRGSSSPRTAASSGRTPSSSTSPEANRPPVGRRRRGLGAGTGGDAVTRGRPLSRAPPLRSRPAGAPSSRPRFNFGKCRAESARIGGAGPRIAFLPTTRSRSHERKD
ncbi:MAG: VCBS repeat-containing protein [Planctomycetota bacterium]